MFHIYRDEIIQTYSVTEKSQSVVTYTIYFLFFFEPVAKQGLLRLSGIFIYLTDNLWTNLSYSINFFLEIIFLS